MLKTTIPFAEVRFFDDVPRRIALEQRFTEFLNKLRHAKVSMDPQSGGRIDTEDGFEGFPCALSRKDRLKISNRAAAYLNRVEGATGMQHLRDDDRKRLSSLRGRVVVSRVPTEHDADVLASVLHGEMPWMAPATEHIWHALRKSVRGDQPGFQFAPLLLLGPPGIGKSHWARRLGELLEVPTTVVDATVEPASFALVGSQRGWSNAEPGKIIETIVASRCANPIIVVDEVEKAGEVSSNNGSRFSLTDALLPFLERMTASTWQCPYYRIKCDMSWVGWVLTANSLEGLSDALLSRCPPLDLPPISKAHLVAFARRQCQSRELPDEAVDAIEEIIWMSRGDIGGPSLRTVKRMIDRAEITVRRPMLH